MYSVHTTVLVLVLIQHLLSPGEHDPPLADKGEVALLHGLEVGPHCAGAEDGGVAGVVQGLAEQHVLADGAGEDPVCGMQDVGM